MAGLTRAKRGGRIVLSQRNQEALLAYACLTPWIIGFLVFTLGAMLVSLGLAFTTTDMLTKMKFVGLANVREMAADPLVLKSLWVTARYALGSVPLGITVSLGIALLLNQGIPARSLLRTLYYLPSVVSGVAVAILWSSLLDAHFGLVNWILSWFGIRGPGWLQSPDWALPALIVMSLWSVGGGMIIYLAGLQGIPTTLYDAAMVDGANGWHRLIHITIPMMTPIIFYNLVMGVIGSFQYFTNAYVMMSNNGAGPADSTLFYNLHLYNYAFRYMNMGYASAMAWFLFIIVLVLTLLIFRSSAMWVYYEGALRR